MAVTTAGEITIAAFNIQNFGQKKVQNEQILDTIVRIISRYDVTLVQEIVDVKETVIDILMQKLNEQNDEYNCTVGERVGRTKAKEQYAYIYKTSTLKLVSAYVYPDLASDDFERDPLVAVFQPIQQTDEIHDKPHLPFCSPFSLLFAIIGIHVKPNNAVQELKQLHKVVKFVRKMSSTPNIVVMGDFNADCTYLRQKHWSKIQLRNKITSYRWLIQDDEDTTSTATDCAYDRIVVTGPLFAEASGGIFRFDTEYGLDDKTTRAVSDHYPIFVKYKP